MAQSTQPISPLRQRMIEDMRLRKLAPKTQTSYICAVKKLADYLGHSPHTATAEDLRQQDAIRGRYTGSDHVNPLKSRNIPIELARYQSLKAGFYHQNRSLKNSPEYSDCVDMLNHVVSHLKSSF